MRQFFAAGYYTQISPSNIFLMTIGGAVALFAILNVSLFGPAGGYSILGRDLIAELNEEHAAERPRMSLKRGILHILKFKPTHDAGWGIKNDKNWGTLKRAY